MSSFLTPFNHLSIPPMHALHYTMTTLPYLLLAYLLFTSAYLPIVNRPPEHPIEEQLMTAHVGSDSPTRISEPPCEGEADKG